MAEGTVKSKLAALLKAGADEQRVFIAGLSDAQRAQVGTPDKWSAKDQVAHNASAQGRHAEIFRSVERGEPPEKIQDIDEHNLVAFQKYHNHSWPEIIAAVDASYAALLALLERYSEAYLTTPNGLMLPLDNPPWRLFMTSGFTHPMLHFADYYLEHGDMERATAFQKRLAEGTASLGDDDSRGIADYNLACFYAKTGQEDSALALLPNAMKLAPRLVEWSKQDTDLVSLQAEPAFQALYAEPNRSVN